jgi:hypothetical protein
LILVRNHHFSAPPPDHGIYLEMDRNGALVLAGVSHGTQLVLPGGTLLRRAVSEVMTSAFGWQCQVWWCHWDPTSLGAVFVVFLRFTVLDGLIKMNFDFHHLGHLFDRVKFRFHSVRGTPPDRNQDWSGSIRINQDQSGSIRIDQDSKNLNISKSWSIQGPDRSGSIRIDPDWSKDQDQSGSIRTFWSIKDYYSWPQLGPVRIGPDCDQDWSGSILIDPDGNQDWCWWQSGLILIAIRIDQD